MLAMTLLTASPAHAQVTGNALLLAQSGNRLYTSPADRLGAYTQVDLEYAQAHWLVGGRFESDRTSDDTPGSREAQYGLITRRFAQWESGASRVRIGQFGTILGRGLLHRSYELPGVVYDEPGSRTRYAATRDVDGVLAEWGAGPLALRAFSGRPSDGTVSPASEARGSLRYAGVLSGAQVEGRLGRNMRAGFAATRYAFGSAPDRHAGSGFASLDLAAETGAKTWSLPLAFEYAQGGGSFREGLRLRRGPETPHAMYASAAVVAGRWSLSAEYKDYDAFRTGLNDPPPLVREHTAALLNRATHVLDADGEEGVQWELQGPLVADLRFVANLARSSGEALTAGGRYEERFGELVWAPEAKAWSARAFVARGEDTFDFVGDRHAWGVGMTRESGAWGARCRGRTHAFAARGRARVLGAVRRRPVAVRGEPTGLGFGRGHGDAHDRSARPAVGPVRRADRALGDVRGLHARGRAAERQPRGVVRRPAPWRAGLRQRLLLRGALALGL